MVKCKNCGKKIDPKTHNTHYPTEICSAKCYDNWNKWNKPPNDECPICKTKFYTKPSRKFNTVNRRCCCGTCENKYRSIWFSGAGNHQFGLKGSLNSSFLAR